jgi:protein-S-isoprenylcysteine O-methyltransferase Ste14
MFRIILADLLLVGFFLTEVLLRQKGSAKSLESEAADKKSTPAVGVSYILAIVLLIVVSVFKIGFFISEPWSWIGIALTALGLFMRIWSMRVLGSFYSRTLRVTEVQEIVDRGPYSVIRHPGYLGSLLIWIGTGLAFTNWIIIPLLSILFLAVYIYRIRAEEVMLISAFGDRYIEYERKTWKLVPFIF